jgi:hypothetical protein
MGLSSQCLIHLPVEAIPAEVARAKIRFDTYFQGGDAESQHADPNFTLYTKVKRTPSNRSTYIRRFLYKWREQGPNPGTLDVYRAHHHPKTHRIQSHLLPKDVIHRYPKINAKRLIPLLPLRPTPRNQGRLILTLAHHKAVHRRDRTPGSAPEPYVLRILAS